MLDDVTKKRINTLRQILVGKLPDPKAQVEQITNGLIYKFMNDMDVQSVSMGGKSTYFSGKFAKYSWKNLMDTKTSGIEKIKLYSEAIEQMYNNENLPELFREIFKNSFLPFKDPSTLNMFLKEINEFHYSNSEKLGDAFEYLLSFMGSQGDAGQFRTPRHIIDFIVEIVNPQKNETILDPACGTAGFLISSYKHILNQNTKKNLGDELTASDRKKIGENLNGYDISPDMVKMSLVNMYLHKFTNPKINEYDTLSSEDRWNEYYDVILANPPFFSPKGGITPHNRFGVKSSKAELLFIDYIIEHLKPNGRAGIIVPEGIIFQNGVAYRQLRKRLLETSLVAVVSLPSGIFQPYSAVTTSILILDKNLSKSEENVLFFKVKNDGFSLTTNRSPINENDLPLIKSFYENYVTNNDKLDLEKSIFKISKKRILDNEDFSFNEEIYFDLNKNKNTKIKHFNIDDFVFFQEGPGVLSSQYTNDGYRLINVKNVRNGYLDLKDTKYISKEIAQNKWKHFNIKENDILFTTSGTIGRCAIVKKENLPLSLNTSVVRFKSNDETKLINKFLYWILRSKNFVNSLLIYQTGSAQKNVGPTHIKKLSIPIPKIEFQNQIVDELDNYQKIIDGCRQIIENYKPSIDINPDWKVIELGDICEVKGGKRLPKGEKFENDITKYPYIRVVDFENYSISTKNIKYVSEKIFKIIKNYVISSNDIFISIAGTIGLVGRVPLEFSGANLTENAAKLVLKDRNKIFIDYLMYMLGSSYVQSQIKNKTRAVGVPKLALERIKTIKIPVCSVDIQKLIVENIKKDLNTIKDNQRLLEKNQDIIDNKLNLIWSE